MRRLACAALVVLAPLSARASTVLDQSFETMTSRADLVVRGTVSAQQARWDPTHRRIYTYLEIRTAEALKGSAKGTLRVRTPGGIVGAVGQRVEGAATFTAGEAVLLFLERAPDEAGVFQVSALAAGKVRLAAGKLGELRASRDLRGLSSYRLGAIDRTPSLEIKSDEDLGSADAFLARIRAAAHPRSR